MKIVEPKYEILTDISEGGIKELQQIERVARVCYKSEDKITPDGESAKKLVGFLVKQGHEAMLEHSQLSVLFTCDRGVANDIIEHHRDLLLEFHQQRAHELPHLRMGRHRSTQLEDVAPLTVVGSHHDLGLQAQRQHTTGLFGTHTECDHILIKDFRRFAGIKPGAARRIFCAFTFLVSVGHINIIRPNECQLSAKLLLRVVAVPCALLRKARNTVPYHIYTYWPADDQTWKGSMVK